MPRRRTSTDYVDTPAYTVAEVGRLLQLPPATVRAWFFGMSNAKDRPFRQVLEPADSDHRLLSFGNLCEAHILATIRREHKVSLPKVRDALQRVAARGTARPLLNQRFLVAPKGKLAVLEGDDVRIMDESEQLAFGALLREAMTRIEWSDRQLPVRLFPPATSVYASGGVEARSVAIDPRIGFGRPILASAGVPTSVVRERFAGGDSIDDIAEDFGVGPPDIEEALRFEQRLAA
ncbi:MAG TPA: DUF433 domain-containing protein [Burkholderiaceae bacterium]|nr:DUF433 domain-containing protein [Burkholderiaceae bacterium]